MSAVPDTLYSLAEELLEIERILDDPEVPDDHKQAFIQAWLRTTGLAAKKIEGYCKLIRSLKARAIAAKAEEDYYRQKKQAAENKADRLEETLLWFMDLKGVDRFPAGIFEPHICQAGGDPPVVVLCDVRQLPKDCKKITVEPDKSAIKRKLKAGEKVRGCKFGARGRYVAI